MIFFFNDTATTEIYTLSLHDALPILLGPQGHVGSGQQLGDAGGAAEHLVGERSGGPVGGDLGVAHGQAADLEGLGQHGVHLERSEEHTSELQSRQYLVCRLLLEKKKQ